MNTSLKTRLSNLIRERGEVSYGEICQFVSEEGFKVETATRRLRELDSVEPVMAKSRRGTNYIKAYKWKGFVMPVLKPVFPEKKIETLEVKGQLFTYKIPFPQDKLRDPN